jgi:predicted secreted hydrolase
MMACTKALCTFLVGALTPYYLQAQTTQPVPITPPPQPAVITFPQDLYDHPNELTEWWYYTGNLRGVNGKHYGFELTFFRSVRPTDAPADQPQFVPVIFADLAISDLEGQKHYFHKSLSVLPSPTAGIVEQPWSIHLNDWQLDQPKDAQGLFHLNAMQDDFGLDLYLVPETQPVLHGDNGLFILDGSDGQGDEYYEYYSYPRLRTRGVLKVNGKSIPVDGLSWSDHEFFTLGPTQTFPGWDWFSIQLSDGSSLMLYGLRLPNGQYNPASRGTYVDVFGKVTHLEPGDFTLTPGNQMFHSNVSGADYPVTWKISIPRLEIQLTMSTQLLDQEMPAVPGGGSPSYWEGASLFTGTKKGRPVQGRGFLEMLGYAKQ